MVGVMGVKTRRAQSSVTHACQPGRPGDPCGERPRWRRQNPDVNLLLMCEMMV